MQINALSSLFSGSIQNILNEADHFHKKCGFIVVVVDYEHNKRKGQPYIAHVPSQIYSLLKKNVRFTDMVFRFSQDSWLICVDDCDESFLEWSKFIIQQALRQYTTQSASLAKSSLTTVRGFFPAHNTLSYTMRTLEHEIQLARNHLRHLKGMQSTALPSGTNPAESTDDLMPFIQQAILDSRLFLAFQPVVDRNSPELNYYECLARILDKDGHVVSAGGFISVCEKTGIIPFIDQKIQQLAIQELKGKRNLRLAINVSAITANDPQWLATLRTHMAMRPDLRGRLIIELTETSVFHNIEESIQFISRLRDLGCSVSIDDFGAGYMSLAHLKPDLVQSVKIDAQFIKELPSDPHHLPFIRAIMTLTQPQGIKCIAEGVENAETVKILSQENVDSFQGYYIGKPSHFREWC